MLTAVTVPKWGLAMEDGKIVHWYVAPGAKVSPGDALVDIETPKITNTLEAEEAGTVRRLIADVGDVLPCGQTIAIIDRENSSEDEVDAFVRRIAEEAEKVSARSETGSGTKEILVAAGTRNLNCLLAGDAKGVPIVLIHGFGGDRNNWMFNQSTLSRLARTIALDLPGHGGSTMDVADGTARTLGSILTEGLRKLDIDRCHLVGHSLGGAVAMEIALAGAIQIETLTLIAPAGLGGSVNREYIDAFIGATRRRELQETLKQLFFNTGLVTSDMAEELLRGKRLDGAREALRAIAEANFPNSRQSTDFRERLSKLKMSLLTIWGADDRIIPSNHAAGLRGTVRILANSGHMPHMERASEVNTFITAHIAGA